MISHFRICTVSQCFPKQGHISLGWSLAFLTIIFHDPPFSSRPFGGKDFPVPHKADRGKYGYRTISSRKAGERKAVPTFSQDQRWEVTFAIQADGWRGDDSIILPHFSGSDIESDAAIGYVKTLSWRIVEDNYQGQYPINYEVLGSHSPLFSAFKYIEY